MKHLVLAAAVCAACVDWTRFSGTVKALNMKENTVTIENRDGDLLVIPIDFQVKITERHGELLGFSSLKLDEKITLIRVQSVEIPKTETFEDMNKSK